MKDYAMKVIPLTEDHLGLLEDYCSKCSELGWVNNSSISNLNIDMVNATGTYFCIIENDELVSLAGCYKFSEVSDNAWRVFYRTATLPRKAKNPGLHRGTGYRGRLYIKEFINFTKSTDLYLTTNIHNPNQPTITRYNKHLHLESSLKDPIVFNVGQIELYGMTQELWKIDVEMFYQRYSNDNN